MFFRAGLCEFVPFVAEKCNLGGKNVQFVDIFGFFLGILLVWGWICEFGSQKLRKRGGWGGWIDLWRWDE